MKLCELQKSSQSEEFDALYADGRLRRVPLKVRFIKIPEGASAVEKRTFRLSKSARWMKWLRRSCRLTMTSIDLFLFESYPPSVSAR